MRSINYYLLTILSIFLLMTLFCKDPEVERKIDAHLKLRVQNLKDTSQLEKTISIVFKSNEPLTDLHREVLKNNGIEIVANIGSIYTAKLPARSLYDLAKMRFVESIQGAREMKIHSIDSLKYVPDLQGEL